MLFSWKDINCWQLRLRSKFMHGQVTDACIFICVAILIFKNLTSTWTWKCHSQIATELTHPLFLCSMLEFGRKGQDKSRSRMSTRKEGRANLCNCVSWWSHLSCFITSSRVLCSPLGPKWSAVMLLPSDVTASLCVARSRGKDVIGWQPKEPFPLHSCI